MLKENPVELEQVHAGLDKSIGMYVVLKLKRAWGKSQPRLNWVSPSSDRRANAQNVSASLLPYDGATYFINWFDYPY